MTVISRRGTCRSGEDAVVLEVAVVFEPHRIGGVVLPPPPGQAGDDEDTGGHLLVAVGAVEPDAIAAAVGHGVDRRPFPLVGPVVPLVRVDAAAIGHERRVLSVDRHLDLGHERRRAGHPEGEAEDLGHAGTDRRHPEQADVDQLHLGRRLEHGRDGAHGPADLRAADEGIPVAHAGVGDAGAPLGAAELVAVEGLRLGADLVDALGIGGAAEILAGERHLEDAGILDADAGVRALAVLGAGVVGDHRVVVAPGDDGEGGGHDGRQDGDAHDQFLWR